MIRGFLECIPFVGTQPSPPALSEQNPRMQSILATIQNVPNSSSVSALGLHLAVLKSLYNPNNLEHIENLLKQGFDPNHKDNGGNTVLHLLGKGNFTEYQSFLLALVNLLLQYGADAAAENKNKETPLHALIKCRGDASTIKRILREKPDLNAQDVDGNTPLHILASLDHADWQIASLLLEHGALTTIPNNRGKLPIHNKEIRNLLLEHERLSLISQKV